MFRWMMVVCAAAMVQAACGQPEHGGHADAVHAHPAIVTVRGDGQATGDPDRVRIQFGVTFQATTAGAAQSRVSAVSAEMIEAIKGLGLEGALVQTLNVSLSPTFDYRNQEDGQPRLTGYRADNTVMVRFDDVTRAGEAIDAAVKAGANQVNSISLEVRDEAPMRREALGKAVGEARGKAEAIAGAMGMRLGALREVREEGAATPIFPRFEGMAMRASADVSTPVEAGEVSVRASIVATYELVP